MVPLTPLVKSLLNGEFLTPVNYRAQTTVCVLPTERVSLDLLLGYTGHGEQLSILTGLSITLWSLGHALEADLKVNLLECSDKWAATARVVLLETMSQVKGRRPKSAVWTFNFENA